MILHLDDVMEVVNNLNRNSDEYNYTFLVDGSGNIITPFLKNQR